MFKQRGQSMIEFIIFAPIMLFFVLIVVDFTLLFLQHQRGSTIVRETALSTYQKCPIDNLLFTCLDNNYDRMTLAAQTQYRDFDTKGTIILSYWAWDLINTTQLNRIYLRGEKPLEQMTKYNSQADFSSTVLAGKHPYIIVAELYYEFEPVTSALNLINVDLPDQIYETVII